MSIRISNFKTRGNQTLKYIIDKKGNFKNSLIYLNGLESHFGWFKETSGKLAKENIAIYGLDRRGSGLNMDKSAKDYQTWIDDIDDLIKEIKLKNPDLKINLTSLCFGAKIASAYTIQNPNKIDSLIYLSPGFNMKINPSFKEKMMIAKSVLFKKNKRIPSPIKNDEMFTSSGEYLKFLKIDNLRNHAPATMDFFQSKLLDFYISRNLRKITTPSLVCLAGNDQIVNNKKTKKTLKKFGKKPELIEYPKSEHTIFFGFYKDQLIEDIVKFIFSN